ncbi:MAG: DegT/DnrJ/EryC1/StrS family aminotransferase [Bacteroidales bacterium]|nr:DegT/DnrJ/EryC1/StrS family aminotransferase [Bacteroidales bacterium]
MEEVTAYMEKIWENKWLTNNGQFHQELEKELADYLGVPYISLFANGTLALLTALQALDVKGEVITTPYTFVATANALVWNNITPVFVDVESDYCNLDPQQIEAAITPETTAIMPVHVYGNPCNHDAIQAIADQHQLKVIYDAAHAFGVKENKKSVLNYGDLSVLSFHATKVFNTFEGGAIICHSPEMKAHIDDLKNFGFRGETQVILPGINGKMNEVQAAMGLVQLKHFDKILAKRRAIYDYYVQALAEVDGIDCIMPKPTVELNASYFPIFVSSAYPLTRDELYEKLREENIFARRYFYPLVPDFKAYEEVACDADLPIARKKSEQVICLPIYPDLEMSVVERIVKVICNK